MSELASCYGMLAAGERVYQDAMNVVDNRAFGEGFSCPHPEDLATGLRQRTEDLRSVEYTLEVAR
jgi:hypothetical protein